jgi:hypothetical protein
MKAESLPAVAQGNALCISVDTESFAPKWAVAIVCVRAFALSGRFVEVRQSHRALPCANAWEAFSLLSPPLGGGGVGQGGWAGG